jgi:hypothetical protein
LRVAAVDYLVNRNCNTGDRVRGINVTGMDAIRGLGEDVER